MCVGSDDDDLVSSESGINEVSRLQERVDEEHAQVAQLTLALQAALERIDTLEQTVWDLRQVGGTGTVLDVRSRKCASDRLADAFEKAISERCAGDGS